MIKSEFDKERAEDNERRDREAARESIMMRSILATDAGQWLFRLLIEETGFMVRGFQGSSWDAYNAGKRAMGLRLYELVERHGSDEQKIKILHGHKFMGEKERRQ